MSRLEREINLGMTPHDRLADGRNIWAAPALLYRRWAQEPGLMNEDACRYRGYDIIPRREWSHWCVGIYPTRPDLPILARSTLRNLAANRKDALSAAKQRVDKLLATLDERRF